MIGIELVLMSHCVASLALRNGLSDLGHFCLVRLVLLLSTEPRDFNVV